MEAKGGKGRSEWRDRGGVGERGGFGGERVRAERVRVGTGRVAVQRCGQGGERAERVWTGRGADRHGQGGGWRQGTGRGVFPVNGAGCGQEELARRRGS